MLDVTNVKKIHWQKYIGPVGILANLNVDHLICWPWIRKNEICTSCATGQWWLHRIFFKVRHSCAQKSITEIHGKRAEGVQCNGRFSLAWKFWREWVKKSASQLSSPRLSLRMLGGLLPQQHSAANYWGCISVQCEGMRGGGGDLGFAMKAAGRGGVAGHHYYSRAAVRTEAIDRFES